MRAPEAKFNEYLISKSEILPKIQHIQCIINFFPRKHVDKYVDTKRYSRSFEVKSYIPYNYYELEKVCKNENAEAIKMFLDDAIKFYIKDNNLEGPKYDNIKIEYEMYIIPELEN